MGRFFARLTLVHQLIMLGVLTLVSVLSLQAYSLYGNRTSLLEDQKAGITDMVDATWGVIDAIRHESTSGNISEAEAQKRAIALVASLRYGESAYFWINDMDGNVLQYPKQELIGTNLLDASNKDGSRTFPEMIDIARNQGAGFAHYQWKNPLSNLVEDKIAYIRTYPAWGWVIGTGIYPSQTRTQFFAGLRDAALAMSVFAPLLGLMLWFIGRRISRTSASAIAFAEELQGGNLQARLHVEGDDELARLARALQSMQIRLRERIDKEAVTAAENQRIRQALDSVSAGVLVADENDRIIYLNDALRTIFERGESDIRQALPQFSAARIDGLPLPQLDGILCHLEQPDTDTECVAGKRQYRSTCNPVTGSDGRRIGYVVELRERTHEARTERDIQQLLDAAKRGELNVSLKATSQPGFLRNVALGMNELVEIIGDSIDDIKRVSRSLASGALDQSITKHYAGAFGEVADNLNDTVAHLSGMAAQLRDANVQIRDTSQEMVNGNHQLSQRTDHSAAQLQHAASSLNQLAGAVSMNADSTNKTNELAQLARVSAQHGGQTMGEAIEAMNGINEASAQISKIIGVINEIAFQTNLLALNASVEAARAGEQGRGFAVVATEVRNLAQRSATAADEIKHLIENSSARVSTGQRLVNRAGDGLSEIRAAVEQVGDLVRTIADSIGEQNTTIQSVNHSVAELEVSIQQNAALAEQATAASATLQTTAKQMDRVVCFFKDGKAAAQDRLPLAS
ncbi:methyl-accepting chemotaxis protein [Granulosicoccaceae sp. 1_MG-2023]|nr:methyl-accepting chemotaxis protein [Granulosicoccaceae sp. 1_MG-2023]